VQANSNGKQPRLNAAISNLEYDHGIFIFAARALTAWPRSDTIGLIP
jgi:hypothetical protein